MASLFTTTPGRRICISPLMSGRCRTTQLSLDTALHQVCNLFLMGTAGRHPLHVVSIVVQGDVARIRVKHSNHPRRGAKAPTVAATLAETRNFRQDRVS